MALDKDDFISKEVADRLSSARSWFSGVRGQNLVKEERQFLDAMLSRWHGHYACSLGIVPDPGLFRNALIDCPILLAVREDNLDGAQGANVLRLSVEEWPIRPHSMHLVVLHHTLEFVDHPHDVLREACRSIKPGGHLIIVGFNTRSLWNAFRLLGAGPDRVMRKAHFYKPALLSDWLALLGLRVCELQFGTRSFPLPGRDCAGSGASKTGTQKKRYMTQRLGTGCFYILTAIRDWEAVIPCRSERPETAGHRLLSSVACAVSDMKNDGS